ncbi:hypothetical protein BCR43DRAFT_482733 [Syncephalastrum racemosum]|uniref:Protein kinase domain-containing protein n=1 Tax=Syncephalastrum racemosum TaxID=13706 RepID=A0A1X2HU20_SYNRA|nr:hypothetical protein BCR43DRAFT_482733 [Syncephalastrum racemosum]
MSPCQTLLRCILVFIALAASVTVAQLGTVQTNVPWRAAHAAAFLKPYVILYGGTVNTGESYSGTVHGSTDVWVWDSRNGSWYNAQPQKQNNTAMQPQVYFGATPLPSSGQMIAVANNISGGGAMLQKLDTNTWSWSFPSSSTESPGAAAYSTITTVDNTIYTYGGSSVDANGFPQSNAVLNSLYSVDANSFAWTSGSNGPAITGHTTCYLEACNCLVTFGGTSTGSGSAALQTVTTYSLSTRSWNLQVSTNSSSGASPGARYLHTASCMKDKMIVYGGGTTQPFDSDVWVLDASKYPTLTWERKSVANADVGPGARMGHTAVLDDSTGKIYIFGGWGVSATGDSNMYLLDTNTWSWQRISTAGMSNNNSNATESDHITSGSNTGTIVGAVVGSVAGAAILAGLLLFFLWRRRRQQRKTKKEVDTESEKSDDNPFYWVNGDRLQNSREMLDNGGGNRKRVSKAMTGSFSFRDSATYRRSEIGDTDKVMTGVLTEVTSPVDTSSEQSYSNGQRDSAHASKALLLPSSELRSAQVPNEILSQKPNEFSVPASRMAAQINGAVPVNHYVPRSPASISGTEGAPLSSSMEVLRSIRTNNGSSMLNHAGSAGVTTRDGILVTHATHVGNSDDDNTSYNDSNSYRGPTVPIQYIPPSSKQFSIATTATESANTNDGHHTNGTAVPLVHHQYPSSNISSVPVARPITPVTEDSQAMSQRISDFNQQQGSIYNSVSPLEMLAALSRFNEDNSNEPSPAAEKQGRPTTAAMSPILNGSNNTTLDDITATDSTPSSIGLSKDQQARFAALEPFINMLPKRYQIILSDPPIIGPMNSVLFVQFEGTQAVIKSFGRREAWERECRTLIKLKSPHVVDLLEVLTIQDESRTPLPRRKDGGSSDDSTDFGLEIAPDDDQIKYATVMGRLNETLGSAIRKARSQPQSWTRRDITGSVKGVLDCLAWCHSKGIAFCDLKPSNIMRAENGPWKLIDFEASRTIGEECVGVITPRYCPPEVARATTYGLEGAQGVVATPSVDLWALGCVIYELETKHALFANNIKDETILHFISHPSPSTPILNNGLRWSENKELYIPNLERKVPNPRARQLITMLLSREPSKRGSASELLEHPYLNQ